MEENKNKTTQETPAVSAEKIVVPEKEEIKNDDLGLKEDREKADPDLTAPYKGNPFFEQVASYFNVDSRDYDTAAPKLGVIVDWIQEKFGVKTPEDILLKLREAEDMVQRPGWDEKRYTNLYKYVYLDNQALAIEKAKKAFRRGQNG